MGLGFTMFIRTLPLSSLKATFKLVLFVLCSASTAFAVTDPKAALDDINPTTKLGARLDLNLIFTDSEGKTAPLRELILPSKPIIILPVYYGCPRLCGLVMSGVARLLNQIKLTLGTEFQVIAISFDKTDTPENAAEAAQKYRSQLTIPENQKQFWRFLVGSEANIKAFTEQLGFHFKQDQGEFVHSAVIMLLTPEGEISQYFTGIDYPAWDVRLALIDASRGAIGSAMDHVLLFCFRFDPLKGKYTWAVTSSLRIGGALTLILLVGLIFGMRRRELLSRQT